MSNDVRWLDDTEMRAWRGLIDCWRLLGDQLERGLSRRSGMSLTDYDVLVHLSEAPERRLRMTELAGVSLLSKSRLSHQITRLERIGWVARTDCPTDRRGAYAVLTDDGMHALEDAAPGHVEDVRELLLAALNRKQISQLGELMTILRDHLEEPADAPAPPRRRGMVRRRRASPRSVQRA